MAETTHIQWTDATFNPWIGCSKVSAGCQFCYAEADFDKRKGRVKWGPKGTRSVTSASYWAQPHKWNRDAAKLCIRKRVFCASLADVFEGWDTMPESAHDAIMQARKALGKLITDTPNLDWLLLTKRPENILTFARDTWIRFDNSAPLPPNVWVGTSVENQETADERIPHLLKVRAHVRFLSCEPLLGPIDFQPNVHNLHGGIHWCIVGGESGTHARPMHPDWVRSIRNQCDDACVEFHFKQWGENLPAENAMEMNACGAHQYVRSHDGCEGLQQLMVKVGKKKAGRFLDGQEWNGVPKSHSGYEYVRRCKECGIDRPTDEMTCPVCAARKTLKA